MLRALFITLSKLSWAQRLITSWSFAWNMASRFIAGETKEQAIEVVKQLNLKGINATLDHLGENTTTPEEASVATDEVIAMLKSIYESGAHSNVSVKLSQIGLLIGDELCQQNLVKILKNAQDYQNFVRIDMEDSTLTEKTLNIYRWVRSQGFDNTGVVVQSYLYRTEEDINNLLDEHNVKVRLCKGAYKEPADVAYPKKTDVDASFDRITRQLMEGSLSAGIPKISEDGRIPPIPGIATHDSKRISYAVETAKQLGLPKEALEFQMLFGIRRDLQDQLVSDGYPVRVYVPYGTRWYPYFMRRLAERPANVWFFISNYFH